MRTVGTVDSCLLLASETIREDFGELKLLYRIHDAFSHRLAAEAALVLRVEISEILIEVDLRLLLQTCLLCQ